MSTSTVAALAAAAAVLVAAVAASLVRRDQRRVASRLGAPAAMTDGGPPHGWAGSFSRREGSGQDPAAAPGRRPVPWLMRAAAQAVAARLPPRVVAELCPPATVRRLDAAGRPGGLGVAEVAGTRVLAAVAGAMLAVAMAGLGAGPRAVAVWMLAGAVGGPLLIEGRLARLARLRAAAIDEAMPDFADLVSVCVEAGMGIDEALDRVGGRADGPLAVELARYGAERRLGATSERALGSLGDRAGSDALAAFCGALCQSATLGVPIAETLRAQAVDQRLRRRQRAQDRAHRAAPKLQLVIAFLILPGVLVLVFGTIVLGAIAAGGPAW